MPTIPRCPRTGVFRDLLITHLQQLRKRGLDSNQRPSGYEPDKLDHCYTPHRNHGSRGGIRTHRLSCPRMCLRHSRMPASPLGLSVLHRIRTCTVSVLSAVPLPIGLQGHGVSGGSRTLNPLRAYGPQPQVYAKIPPH